MPRGTKLLPPDNVVMMHSHQVDRCALATMDGLDRTFMILNTTNTHGDASRFDRQFITHATLSSAHATGYDRSMARNRKHSVDWQPKRSMQPFGIGSLRNRSRGALQRSTQFVEPLARYGARSHDR